MTDAPATKNATSQEDKKEDKKPAPDPPALAALKARNALLEQQIKLADNQQKVIGAAAPSNTASLEGTVKVEGDHPIESHVLAYRAVSHLAEDIAAKAKACGVTRVLIHSEAEINGLIALQAVKGQIDLLASRMAADNAEGAAAVERAKVQRDIPAPPPEKKEGEEAEEEEGEEELEHDEFAATTSEVTSAVLAAGAVARTAVDVFSLFRTDESLKHKDLAINDQALAIAVCGALKAEQIEVYFPSLTPPRLFMSTSDIVQRLSKSAVDRQSVDATILAATDVATELEQQVQELTTRLASATRERTIDALKRTSRNKKKALEALQAAKSRLIAGRELMSAFELALTKPDDATGVTALARLLRAEKLLTAAGNDAHLLYVKVAIAGGGIKTLQSRLALNARVFYSGGAVAQFGLFDSAGTVVAAGISPAYSGFVELQSPDQPATSLTAVEFNKPSPNTGFPSARSVLRTGALLIVFGVATTLMLGFYGPRQAPGLWAIGLVLTVMGVIWTSSALRR